MKATRELNTMQLEYLLHALAIFGIVAVGLLIIPRPERLIQSRLIFETAMWNCEFEW